MPNLKEIKPIIILGVNRNGTTMLANKILENYEVSGLNHPHHYGFFESNMFPNHKYYGSLNSKEKVEKFLNQYSLSDAFLISGLEKKEMLGQSYRDFIDFFFTMNEKMAIKNEHSFFLIKLDPDIFNAQSNINLIFNRIKERYKDHYVLCIKRKYQDYLNSQLFMTRSNYSGLKARFIKSFKKMTSTAYYHFYYDKMEKFVLNDPRYFTLKFEEVLRDEGSLFNILDSVPIKKRKEKISISSIINSSFQDPEKLRKKENAPFFNSLFGNMPFLGLWVHKFRRMFRPAYKKPILYHRLSINETKDLEQKGQVNLAKALDVNQKSIDTK